MKTVSNAIQELNNWQTLLHSVNATDPLEYMLKFSRHKNGEHIAMDALPGITKAACSPPTPPGLLDTYLSNVKFHSNKISATVNSLTTYNIDMAIFANQVNDYMAYIKSISDTFCIGPSNRVAYDALDINIKRTNIVATSGITKFENNLRSFYQKALPFLQNIIVASNAITSASKDYSQVSYAVQQYNDLTARYSVDIWLLSAGIQQIADQFNPLSDQAAQASNIALFQIQVNVETEARIILQQAEYAKAALKHWETVDGKVGYERYAELVHYLETQLIPSFAAFIEKVPKTARVQAAMKTASDAVAYIVENFNTFPKFKAIPTPSDSFPYTAYGKVERMFGEDSIVAILQRACIQYFQNTGSKLYIGDMQLQHGGKFGTHVSHKEGKDADVDVMEAGNIPDHNTNIALNAAKLFLDVGAALVFYADQNVVDDANEWAIENSLTGRLVFERNHTRHFHLRA